MDKLEQRDFIFYTSPQTGEIVVKIALRDDNIWSTQKGMSLIFNTDRTNITKHLKNIFSSGELIEDSVCDNIAHTAKDGKTYKTTIYSLDVIIALGYRVNSYEATQFRIWATKVLKEYLVKGFVLDDERLKQSKQLFSKDYFDELLARIREIRASERRFYQKITDLYRDASLDYNKDAPATRKFYKIVQNKLIYAVTGLTAAELISSRADSKKENMGLLNWSGQKSSGKIVSTDITVSKNYLRETELQELNRLVSMFLDFAENLVSRKMTFTMLEWTNKLNDFLSFNSYDILNNAGKVSKVVVDKKAKDQFKNFRTKQDIEHISDFDKTLIQIKMTGKLPESRFKTYEIEEAEEVEKEPLSTFNKGLKKMLETNPKKDN